MADITNLSQFLSDVADAIRTKKETTEQIPAENFDQEILSIETGIDTSDATALASDLLKGKTAYNAEGKIEGTLELKDGDVKLFETVEEMQADTTSKEGDLAIVYRSEVQNATVDSKFQVATFPDTVVLDNAMTDYAEVRYRAVDSSKMFECMGQLDSSNFMMDCYTETGDIRIQYTSSDGITYTRTDTTGNPVDFGTEIYYYRPEMWNDAIGKFIQTGGNVFEGLYEYTLNFKDVTKIRLPLLVDGEFDTTNKQYNVTKFSAAFDVDKIVKLRDKIREDYGILTDTISGEFNVFAKNGKLVLLAVHNRSGNGSLGLAGDIRYYSESKKFKIYSSYNSTGDVHEFVLDLDNMTYTDTVVGTQNGAGSSPSYFELDYEVQSFRCFLRYGSEYGNNPLTNFEAWFQYDVSETYNATGIGSDYYDVYDAYIPIKSQLTLSNPNELLPGKIAYGKNGVVTGDDSIYDNLSQENVLTKIYGLTKTPDLDYYTGINKQTDLLLTRNIVDKYKYNMVRLKKLDNFDPNNTGMVIPLNNIKISKHNLYQFSDIIPESDLGYIADSGSMILSDDGKTLGLINLYNGNSYIIDLETHSIVKTFITRNVKSYKHKVFYATNNLTNTSSSDLNYYCYDLNTRENTIVATRPIGSVKNKYICRVNTSGRIITLLTYDRDDSTRNYPNAVNATFIDCESNQTSSMTEISWTTSGNYVGNVISCATNDGVYILVYKYKVDNPVSVIKCDLNLATSTLLRNVTLSGTNPIDETSSRGGIQYNNILIYNNASSAYYINLANKTSGYLSNMQNMYLSSNNIAMAYKDGGYYPITGIDSTNSYSLILDESKFIPDGYERTRMYGTEVYMCLRMYETILTLETNSIAVVSWGNIVANKFNVTLLTTVQDDTYDYIAINIGGTNSNTGPRFIPLGNTDLFGSISQEEYNQALTTANEIKGGNV